jgi:1-deoxy-D-xylulose-5-phosphate reductoisomerase
VAAFVEGRLRFTGIVDTLARVLEEHRVVNLQSVSDVVDAETWARGRAGELTS